MNVRIFITAAMTGLFVFSSQEFVQASDYTWQATRTRPPDAIDVLVLTVKGVCEEPTPGYKLTLDPVNLPQPDASMLTLVLNVAAPTGIEPDHVTPTTVEYSRTFVIS
jgi:hypothetical protein